MNILITGATGFVGKTLLRKIAEESDFAKDNIILLSGTNIDGYVCINHNGYTFTKQDFINKGIDGVDVVIHLGSAVPRTKADYLPENEFKFIMNVRNTIHLYENLPSVPQKVIYISSVDVYQGIYQSNGNIISEETPLAADTMYAASKIMCEKYLDEKSKTDGFVLQILRLGQIYGNGEEIYSKIVSSFVRQIENDQQIKIFSDGSEFRSQLLVDDCCECILKAVFLEKSIGAVNLVSDQAVSIKDIVLKIYTALEKEPNIVFGNASPGRSNRFDNTKMKQVFGITETPLENGIRAYADYYRKKGNGND